MEEETVFHILWTCPSAVDVWGASERCFQKGSLHDPDILRVVEGFLNNYGKEALTVFVDTARRIWFRRNEVIHRGVFSHPNAIVGENKKAVEEYCQANATVQGKRVYESSMPLRWIVPPPGWCKANWDLGLDKQPERFGMGVVVRDQMGDIVIASCTTRPGIPDPTSAEAMGALFAASFWQQIGIRRLILEGDAQVIVKVVAGLEGNGTRFVRIVDGTRKTLDTFQGW
ncbi:uncharacterized protein LOC132178490 [Corylus avellana]|uniref:uncharacterized protein LOC132178490 n=1 Tax=Corylus avellana TaxID=13451 RepID=UPI00286D2108|nr:uncharacterized protein LOC132178490 [Corylus avellana]